MHPWKAELPRRKPSAPRNLGVMAHLPPLQAARVKDSMPGGPALFLQRDLHIALSRSLLIGRRPTSQEGQPCIHLVHVGTVMADLPLWAGAGPSIALDRDGEAVDLRDHACLL
jgi:hypothetical protein